MDIGTGDGHFVYQSALKNPNKFYIGIDASTSVLEKVSEKIYRKPNKGGARNVLFIQAAVENLPEDLNNVADEVHIHFPWGSLLQAVLNGEATVLAGIRRICTKDTLLEVIIGVDKIRDRTELERLDIQGLDEQYIKSVLISRYAENGFKLTEYGTFEPGKWPEICTSWRQKLSVGSTRSLIYFIAQAI